MTPKRIQRKRTKGWRMPPNTKYVGRPGKYGNQWRLDQGFTLLSTNTKWITVKNKKQVFELLKQECVKNHRIHIEHMLKEFPDYLEELRGFHIACWCKEGEPCHGDTLLELANRPRTKP